MYRGILVQATGYLVFDAWILPFSKRQFVGQSMMFQVLFIINGSQVGNFSRAAFSVNPQEIKRIEVLKNPSDIASYGIVGSGSVVMITTE